MRNFSVRIITIAASLFALSACGGGNQTADSQPRLLAKLENTNNATNHSVGGQSKQSSLVKSNASNTISGTSKGFIGTTVSEEEEKKAPPSNSPDLATQKAAARFLSQASFGANMNDIVAVSTVGNDAWLNEQFYKPQTSYRTYLDVIAAQLPAGTKLQQRNFFEAFWKQAATANDPLRQRVTFALSEIFVVSFQNSNLPFYTRGTAAYYDTLASNAFGNYRNLLSAVARHPMMGLYLSSMGNKKETATSVPDENFAREVMQLFSIGLHQLNQDGSVKLSNGQPIETYTHDDIAGLSKALTGWSWAGPDTSTNRFLGYTQDPNRDWLPMQNYASYHSTSEKSFLGKTISAGSSGEADMNLVIDTLFNHPNVGPFIGKQLIQRLVTSNPSPAYVERVAMKFANNGQGVRGDMKAVIRAILLDPEAQSPNFNPQYPSRKLREPVVRLAHWMRAFNATSATGKFLIGNIDDPLTGLGQNPLRSPTVFNYFRPGYVPPNTSIANAGLTAPEMQTTGEISVAGYLNFMMDVIPNGIGTGAGVRDVRANYSAEMSLAGDAAQLVDRIDLLLLNGTMSGNLRNQILTAVNSVTIPDSTSPTSESSATLAAKANRVYLAIFLTMASPEYIVQK